MQSSSLFRFQFRKNQNTVNIHSCDMRKILKLFTFIFLLSKVLCEVDDDVLSAVEKAGYVGKSHELETEDGYILKLHHVASSTKKPSGKKPILLVHGLSATSHDYIATGPKKALAYLLSGNYHSSAQLMIFCHVMFFLSDSGYEVFMGNVRGSKHGMNHRNFSLESKEFWNFSFHEIGIYDVAAMIDFILHETKSKQLFYVGHSQGEVI